MYTCFPFIARISTRRSNTVWQRTIPSRRSRYRIQPIKCTFFQENRTKRDKKREENERWGGTTQNSDTGSWRSEPEEDFVGIYCGWNNKMSSVECNKWEFYIRLYICVAASVVAFTLRSSNYFLFLKHLHLNREVLFFSMGPNSRVSIAN